jgi:ketosteroid isomerase-like protein
MKQLLFALLLVVSLLACKTTTKPPFDLVNAKKEIEAANRELSELLAKGDSVGLAAAYGADGALLLNNMPIVKGKENLIKLWGSFINAGMSGLELTTTEIWGDENYITEEGIIVIKTKDGTQIDKGKYLVLWKKENGKWCLHRDISNSDLPVVTK